MLCQIIQFNVSPPSPDQAGPLLFLPLKLLMPCFTPLSRPGWTFALPSSQVAGALLHPPLPTRLDLCSSFLSSCWCLASPAEWSRYIAIYLGLPSECRHMACRLTSDIFTKECQQYSLHPVLHSSNHKLFQFYTLTNFTLLESYTI